jgi:cyclase
LPVPQTATPRTDVPASRNRLRLIPRLDIKGPNLVKGVHMEGLRVLGKPEHFAREYYQHGADELLFMDAVASLYGRNSLLDIVGRTSREVFIPLIVGGGLRSLDDVHDVLRAGADKVSINTAAVARPAFITEVARRFGSSTVVVSIDVTRTSTGGYEALTDGGRERTGLDAVEWARRAETLGAGEILLTSVDREGTGRGFDVPITRIVSDAVGIPVIASGGCASAADVLSAANEGRADGVCVASVLHYWIARHEPSAGEFDEAINQRHIRGAGFAKIRDTSLAELKATLRDAGWTGREAA